MALRTPPIPITCSVECRGCCRGIAERRRVGHPQAGAHGAGRPGRRHPAPRKGPPPRPLTNLQQTSFISEHPVRSVAGALKLARGNGWMARMGEGGWREAVRGDGAGPATATARGAGHGDSGAANILRQAQDRGPVPSRFVNRAREPRRRCSSTTTTRHAAEAPPRACRSRPATIAPRSLSDSRLKAHREDDGAPRPNRPGRPDHAAPFPPRHLHPDAPDDPPTNPRGVISGREGTHAAIFRYDYSRTAGRPAARGVGTDCGPSRAGRRASHPQKQERSSAKPRIPRRCVSSSPSRVRGPGRGVRVR